MSDFGRRHGDMFKADYDPDEDGLVTAAELHAGSHESGGDDEIDVSGLVGAGGAGILGDGTWGRYLRGFHFKCANGTEGVSLKCIIGNRFNHTPSGTQDNISKGATTGHYTLDSNGYTLTISKDAFEGNVLFCMAFVYGNATNVLLTPKIRADTNNIHISFKTSPDAGDADITTLVDAGDLEYVMLIITDA